MMDVWADSSSYDSYMGRWSRLVAREFVDWLAVRSDAEWLDVGCSIVVPTRFRDFDDLWQPFIGGQGPAPGYVATLDPAALARLRDALRTNLPASADGSIELTARAWAARAWTA